MSEAEILHDEVYRHFLAKLKTGEPDSKETTTAISNIKLLNESRPPKPEPVPETIPEPNTFWGKFKDGLAKVYSNETTRVAIKSVGALGGVALVTWTTIHRDHVITREAQTQANQRPE